MQTQKEKTHYTVLQNIRYCYSKLNELRGKKYLVLLPFYILCGVMAPLLFAILPSGVIKALTSELAVGDTLLLIVGYTLLVCGVQLILKRMELKSINETFFFRIEITREFTAKALSIPYEDLESEEGKKRLEKATTAIYSGNHIGIEAMINLVTSFFTSGLGLLAYALISATLHPLLMLLLIVCPLARMYRAHRNRKWHEKAKEEWTPIDVKLRYLEKECLEVAHGKDIRMYQIESWFVDLFHQLIDKRFSWRKKEEVRTWSEQCIDRILVVVRDVACYGYLLYQVYTGMDIALFVLYLGIIAGFSQWVQSLFEHCNGLLDNNIIMNDYRDFMEQDDYWQLGGDTPVPKADTHTITLEDVCYSYPGSETPVFENLNLTIRKGEKLAVVGANGSGKSTLIKLICGIYKPQKGRILIDGVDVGTLNLKDYYNLYAVVFQEVFAFAFPVVDNITCSVEGTYDEAKVNECLEMAGLKDKVASLPQGMHTNMLKDLEDDGINLSGGQMQKLMLARALYKESRILILDEPTAALDPIAELEMYEKYNAFSKGKTSIFISHRLSSTVFCDRIIFMKEGKIVEDGNHEALMAQEGEYANMYQVQAHYYKEEVEVDAC